MSDEELSISDATLIARLLGAPADGLGTENLCIAAADRIEQLVATNEALVKEMAAGSFYKESDIDALQDRIEQLEASMREIVALDSPEKAWEATLAKNIALTALKGN